MRLYIMDQVQQNYGQPEDTSVMSIKDWVITLVITAIPLVGIIMLFVWSFGDGTNLNKRNWSKAVLIFYVIIAVLYFVFFVVIVSMFFAGGSEMSETLRELENMNN